VDNAGEWLLQLEDQFRPDLIHLNGFSHAVLPWRVPKIVAGHSCVLSWWRATKGCDAPSEWNEYRTRVLEGLAMADLVVAPSRAMLSALAEHYGPFGASAVIPNGRSISRNPPRAKSNCVLGVGRLWDEAKNALALARAARNLPWPVYLAGENRDPRGHETKYSQVLQLGQLSPEKLQAWFERAAIFAAPAKYEPFGLSILEAALADCALVLGDISSLRENWDGAALFIPPEDVDAIESTLQKLIAEPNLRQELSARARKRAQRFTAESMAQNYLNAYGNVLTKFQGSADATENVAPVNSEPKLLTLGKGITCTL
jgi:glycogen(starch) synthase